MTFAEQAFAEARQQQGVEPAAAGTYPITPEDPLGMYGPQIMQAMVVSPKRAVEYAQAPDADADTGRHYRYSYRGIKLDPYRIIHIYRITHPAHQHALKKLLRAGKSVKSLRQDIAEVRDTLTRWLEMLDEDDAHGD